MFNDINEALNWLFSQKKLQKREDLKRITLCASLLKLEYNYKIIHITGTNGKGATATIIKDILKTKYKVGLFISPFIIKFNERIEINDTYISDDEILLYLNYLYKFSNDYYNKYNDKIPFFELTLLMALMYFSKEKIDYAIIECGLGGLLDSTNFLKTDLSIITNVGYDHMAQLGNTLDSIANHKLGIVKENSHLITSVDNSLKDKFNNYIKQKNGSIVNVNDYLDDIKITLDNTTFNYKNNSYTTNLLGAFEAKNASIAIEAVNYLDSSISINTIKKALVNVFHPGRCEKLQNDPIFIIDGAHNESAMINLCSFLNNFKDKKIHVLFTALVDKDYKKMISILDNVAYDYIFTTTNDSRKLDLNNFINITNKPYKIINDYKKAIDDLLNNKDGLLLVTGSLHFISLVRDYYKNNHHNV